MPQYRKKERELSFRRSKATGRKQQKKRKDCKNYSTIPQVKKLSYFVSDL